MALEPVTSIQYDNESTGNSTKQDVADNGQLRTKRITYTCTTAGQGAAYPIGVLPAGKLTIYPTLSRLIASDMSPSAVLDVGWAVYDNEAGSEVTADPDGWFDGVDTGTAAKNITWDGTGGILAVPTTYNSKAGITVNMTVAGGNMDIGDTVDLYIVYSKN